MTSTQFPQLPRHADAQHYAEWAVRRIGRAFALALLGPVVLTAVALMLPTGEDVASVLIFAGSALCVLVAVLSLCFAKAPR